MSTGYSTDRSYRDGPTIEEYIRAGYLASAYPPQGYQPIDSVGWQDEQRRRASEASEIDRQFGTDLPAVAAVPDLPQVVSDAVEFPDDTV